MAKSRFIPVSELTALLNKHDRLSLSSRGRVTSFLLALLAGQKSSRFYSRRYALAYIDYSEGRKHTEMLASDFIRTEIAKKIAQEEKDSFDAAVIKCVASKEGFTTQALASLMGVGINTVNNWKFRKVIFVTIKDGRRVIDLKKFLEKFIWNF